ncbi:MoaD/ThiS family protein [Planctomycetota bacterium]
MRVTVELTYDMAKSAGITNLEMENVRSVAHVVEQVGTRLGSALAEEVHSAALAVNGVLISHRRGMRTRLTDGDIVSFVKAAAGG